MACPSDSSHPGQPQGRGDPSDAHKYPQWLAASVSAAALSPFLYPSMSVPAVLDFYRQVKEHLSAEWSAAEVWTESGIIK